MKRFQRYIQKLENREKELQKTGVWTQDELRREQTRGVFIIGLLAVVIAFRTEILPSIYQPVGEIGLIEWTLFTIIVLWSAYAFSMIISLSEDTFPKIVCLSAKKIGNYLLWGALFCMIFGFLVERIPGEMKPAFMILNFGLLVIVILLIWASEN